ncbi:SUKH-4 family immunity protein [Streptomyces sp. HD]|uniref:SUKH-4 family immunity protein n=1 Tax=Streptomyces sp. HD TaxID=3020892 RepID=UPI00232FA6CC|nr:SUKH-4 family immunity protein [Streptomyces sp. HD]MDC0772178.1 SUKH-4 family immunity protein [Streptomyces sp. HD]
MPEINAEDWARIEIWRELPTRQRRVFSVLGPTLSGKTAFLRAVQDRWPSATLIDCRGMSADTVATRMREECRAAPAGRPCVLLLADVQYAGEVLTSTEPARVAEILAPGFRRFEGREVWVMAEYDPDLVAPPRIAEYEVTLPTPASAGGAAVEEPATARRLGALAAAELRQVPLSVWQLLSSAGGAPTPAQTLLSFAEQRPDVLVMDEDRSSVAFRSEALLHSWRRRQPWDSVAQSRAVEALMAGAADGSPGLWSQQGPLGRYAAQALPLHAALAGALPRLLDDGRMLAQCSATALREALAIAHPDGVPYASVAAMLHYLEVQGISPLSQGEWVAWLHHAALSAGRVELAEQLLASGVPLPWRTTWTHWRPLGVFGRIQGEAGRVDELGVAVGESGPTVITARDVTTGNNAYPKHRYIRQEWFPATGEPASAPVEVRASLSEGDLPWSNARHSPGPETPTAPFAEHTDSGWQLGAVAGTLPDPPNCPSAVTQGLYVDGRWVLTGSGGLFAVSVQAAGSSAQDTYGKRPMVAAHTRPAPWPLPPSASAALRGDGTRDWLEETFGAGACHRLAGDQLPQGLDDPAARRFLTETGLPEISDFLHLAITPRGDRPLPEVAWPGRGRDVPRQRRARSEAPSNGPFDELGTWMYSRLLLDGSTGRLFRDTTGGSPDPVAGSSLTQFFAMVRLYDEFRRTHFPYAADHEDARHNLARWCEQIDGAAARAEAWTLILEGHDFEDSTWDLASYRAEGR